MAEDGGASEGETLSRAGRATPLGLWRASRRLPLGKLGRALSRLRPHLTLGEPEVLQRAGAAWQSPTLLSFRSMRVRVLSQPPPTKIIFYGKKILSSCPSVAL